MVLLQKLFFVCLKLRSASVVVLLLLLLTPFDFASAETEINFTMEQADAGKILYREHCQLCHGSTLSNGQFGTPLKGGFFRNTMNGKSVGELLFFTFTSMPPDNAQLLPMEQYAEIIAYVLERNRLAASDIELSSDYQLLQSVMLPW